MNINLAAAQRLRDARIDLFLGMANWFLFLDHIPNNVVSWMTLRNYGFSGAVDVFIFISGYAAAAAYAKILLERGGIVGATRVLRRCWQLYAAFVVLFAIYIVTIGDVANRYAAPDIIYDFNVAGLLGDPVRTVTHGLILQTRALNLDVLQLYVLLMACFPVVLWAMLRRPALTVAGSLVLYLAARHFDWNLPSFPDGNWYFNPLCWQLLFVLGAACALGEARNRLSTFASRILAGLGVAYLVFALAMTMAGRFPELGHALPVWLHDAFIPNDKTNLAPYRLIHFIVVAMFVTRLVPKDWRGLNWPVFKPLILCGQQSLHIFCLGILLSVLGHFILTEWSGGVPAQLAVNAAGILLMVGTAMLIGWYRRLDREAAGAAAAGPG